MERVTKSPTVQLLQRLMEQFEQLQQRVAEQESLLQELRPAIAGLVAEYAPAADETKAAGATPVTTVEETTPTTSSICARIERLITAQGPMSRERITDALELSPDLVNAALRVGKFRYDEGLGKWCCRRRSENG